MPKCWTCGTDIRFEEGKNGKKVPITVATGNNHFGECNDPGGWSGKSRKQRADEGLKPIDERAVGAERSGLGSGSEGWG